MPLYDRLLGLAQMIDRTLVEAEVRFDQLGRRQRQPLVQRHVFESRRPEQFEEFQRYISGILNVMAHRLRNVAYVARAEVEGSGGILGGEYRHAPRSGQIVLPFVRVGMPMDLPHGLRSNFHDRSCDLAAMGKFRVSAMRTV